MDLLRIVFAIVIGALAYGLMQWLTTAPHGVDVLVGIAVTLIVYFGYPTLRSS